MGKRVAQCEQGRWDEVALDLLRDYNRWSGNQIRKASKSRGDPADQFSAAALRGQWSRAVSQACGAAIGAFKALGQQKKARADLNGNVLAIADKAYDEFDPELQQIVSLFIGATICILVIDDVIISYLHRIIPAAIIPRELLGSRMRVSNNSSIHTNIK